MSLSDLAQPPIVADANDNASKAFSKMARSGRRELLVFDRKKFIGLVNYKALMSAKPSEKVKSRVFKPHILTEKETIEDAINHMLSAGVELLPIKVNGEMQMVTADRLLKRLSISSYFVKDVMDTKPITVSEETTLAAAKSLMNQSKVGRVFVVDDNGQLTGVLTGTDLLAVQMQLKTKRGVKGEKKSQLDEPVSEHMTKSPTTCEPTEDLQTCLERMLRENFRVLPVVKDGKLVGVLAKSHFLELLKPSEEVGIQLTISGLHHLPDDVGAEVSQSVFEMVKKLVHELPRGPLDMVIKPAGQSRYEVKIRAGTGKELIVASGDAYNAPEAVAQALRTFEREVRHG